jgi:hypothetical protein
MISGGKALSWSKGLPGKSFRRKNELEINIKRVRSPIANFDNILLKSINELYSTKPRRQQQLLYIDVRYKNRKTRKHGEDDAKHRNFDI